MTTTPGGTSGGTAGGSSHDPGFVLVGVDGSEAATAAVGYASVEAERLGVGLVLLHVIPMVAIGSMRMPVDTLDSIDVPRLRHRRDRMLGEVSALARNVLPADRVTTHLVAGERVPKILEASADASAVVLGAPWHPRVDRLVTGSVVGAVAAHAAVPVVGVPEGWTDAQERRRVVVGVKNPDGEGAEALIARAIEIAAARKSRLTLLHAWEFPVVYDNMIATTYEEQAWGEVRRGSLEALVSTARGPHHEVAIDYQVRHGQGAKALVDASAAADLVVISRRRHAFPFGHLGAPGRTVLRESRCPVEVVPPA